MLSNDFIRETWEIETGVSEQGVEWDVIGFARAIEQAARREALETAALIFDSMSNRDIEADGCAERIRALINEVD